MPPPNFYIQPKQPYSNVQLSNTNANLMVLPGPVPEIRHNGIKNGPAPTNTVFLQRQPTKNIKNKLLKISWNTEIAHQKCQFKCKHCRDT